jgi:cytidine deaminase
MTRLTIDLELRCQLRPHYFSHIPNVGTVRLIHVAQLCSETNKILNEIVVRFEVFTAVTTKNGVLWDVTPCGYCKNPYKSHTAVDTNILLFFKNVDNDRKLLFKI